MSNTEVRTFGDFVESLLAQVKATRELSHIVEADGPGGVKLFLHVTVVDVKLPEGAVH